MAGSSFGTLFRVTTWGESHGKALGAVVDGVPAGLPLEEAHIQAYLDRRRPGQSPISTPRREADRVEILSGVFEGHTTGTPISLMIPNTSQISADYGSIARIYRPGHADYTFDAKYGFRDYRGGGRSSGRETAGRVAAGAIAARALARLGIDICAYTRSIGPVVIDEKAFDRNIIYTTATAMPDASADAAAKTLLAKAMADQDSVGGVIECRVTGLPAGLGSPVFDKLDALLGHAILSIGAVKAVEIGDGIQVTTRRGSENNDAFYYDESGFPAKRTNHAGGILGGISDGDTLILRAHIKPTPSIEHEQATINKEGGEETIRIQGRHDPIIVPRAVVVVEAMTAITLMDALMQHTADRMEYLEDFYRR